MKIGQLLIQGLTKSTLN